MDSSGAESGINLEFGQDMDGWTFVSFHAELPRMLICNLNIVKILEFFRKTVVVV